MPAGKHSLEQLLSGVYEDQGEGQGKPAPKQVATVPGRPGHSLFLPGADQPAEECAEADRDQQDDPGDQ